MSETDTPDTPVYQGTYLVPGHMLAKLFEIEEAAHNFVSVLDDVSDLHGPKEAMVSITCNSLEVVGLFLGSLKELREALKVLTPVPWTPSAIA